MKRLAILLLFIATADARAAIRGVLIDEQGKPVTGAIVHAYAAEPLHAFRARILRGDELAATAESKSGDGGSFSIDPKTPLAILRLEAAGKAPLLIEAPDGTDLDTIILHEPLGTSVHVFAGTKPVANATIAAGPLVIRSGAGGNADIPEGRSIVVVATDFAPINAYSGEEGSAFVNLQHGVTVRGRVVDSEGKPVANAEITVAGWPLTKSAADGTFLVAHAPANWQTLVASDSSRAAAVVNSRAKSYEVKLVPAASISGTTIPGATVVIVNGGDEETLVAGAEGKFNSGPLQPGRWSIRVLRRGYGGASATVTVKAGEHATRSLLPKALLRVKGQVVDENQKPVAGAIVWSGLSMPADGLAVTGKNGEFEVVQSSSPQPLAIHALKNGYAIGTSGATGTTIVLPRGFPLQIHLVDRARQNVSGANVSVTFDELHFRREAACEPAFSRACRMTGSNGLASLRVTKGSYDVRIFGQSIVPNERPHAITEKSSPLTISVDRAVEISGTVTYADGTPAAGARVFVQPFAATAADDDGTFVLRNIPPGKNTLIANLQALRSDPVNVNAPARDVALTLPTPARIEGRVFDKATNQPVTDFRVGFRPLDGRFVMGGVPFMPPSSFHSDDGSFVLDPVSTAPMQLQVTAAGYAPGSRNDLNLEAGKTTHVDFPLDRGGQVRGRVTAAGDPVSGVFIGSSGSQATSDEEGNYLIDGIATGQQIIHFFKEGFLRTQKSVDVTSGKEAQLDVELDRGKELQGRVIDSSGQPVSGANVSAIPLGGGYAPSSSATDGSFTVPGLADGRYTLQVVKEGYVSSRTNDVVVPAQTPMTVTLHTGGSISGRIAGLSEAELLETRVSATGSGSFASTRANSDGTFLLTGVPEGQVEVSAYVQGLPMRRSTPKSVEVSGGIGPDIELDFPQGFTVTGHVTRNGSPFGFGNVGFSGNGTNQSGMVSADGQYQVTGLAGGTYDVRVFANGMIFQGKTTVAGDSTYDIPIAGATLHGRVVDSSTGAPLAQAYVWTEATPQTLTRSQMYTDSDGQFTLDPIPTGSIVVHASAPHYAPGSQTVSVTDAGAPDVELRLDSAQATAFRVTDAQSGSPMDAFINVRQGTTFIANGSSTRDDDGAIRIYVAPGNYQAMVHAPGYVTQTVAFTVPGPDVAVALQLGGRIMAMSSKLRRIVIRIPSQDMYGMASSFGSAIEGVPPGSYTLDVLGDDGKTVVKSMPVTVVAGQTTTVKLD